MKAKFTPGPWVVLGRRCSTAVGGAHYYSQHIYSETDVKTLPAKAYGLTERETIANAHLIASAPEMLQALIMVEDLFGLDAYETETMAAVRAAIANAKGESEYGKVYARTLAFDNTESCRHTL